jgi:Tol biopolymer transport system component
MIRYSLFLPGTRWLIFAPAAIVFLALGPALRAGDLAEELKHVPYHIVHECFHDGNWELFECDADGSHPVNLTRTPDSDELYPHVSPDGSKICFVADEGRGAGKCRNVYYMNRDGSGRTLVARNGRDPCWNAEGTKIAFLPGEFEEYTVTDYASRGITVYDLAARTLSPHPNKDLHHLYNLCWSPDGAWFAATVHAGMGFGHAILAIEARGLRVVELKIPGCRPDLSSDGKHIAWGASDFVLRTAEIDWSGPRVVRQRDLVTSAKPMEVYHVDWSPDGKYLAFSRGPTHKKLGPAPEIEGVRADGWNICVGSAVTPNRWVQITHDGKSNKEPDWAK